MSPDSPDLFGAMVAPSSSHSHAGRLEIPSTECQPTGRAQFSWGKQRGGGTSNTEAAILLLDAAAEFRQIVPSRWGQALFGGALAVHDGAETEAEDVQQRGA